MASFEPIHDYEGLYSVSTDGEIRNDLTGHILKPTSSKNGVRVALYKNGIPTIHVVKMVVLKTFLGDPPPNHLPVNVDGDLKNNKLTNLAYQSRSTILRKSRKGMVKLTESELMEIRDLWKAKVSVAEIAGIVGVSISTIYRVLGEPQ